MTGLSARNVFDGAATRIRRPGLLDDVRDRCPQDRSNQCRTDPGAAGEQGYDQEGDTMLSLPTDRLTSRKVGHTRRVPEAMRHDDLPSGREHRDNRSCEVVAAGLIV
jgi:hypothetical protein